MQFSQNILLTLTKNDKSVLKFLMQDASMGDSDIGRKLKLSAQAIKKIRKKLEGNGVITGYTPILNYGSFGLGILSLFLIKVTPNGWKLIKNMKGEKEFSNSIPNIIEVYKTQNTEKTHIIICGFRNRNELIEYLNIIQPKLNNFIEIKESYNFPVDNIIKDSFATTISTLLDSDIDFSKPWTIDELLKKQIKIKKSENVNSLVEFSENKKGVLKQLIRDCRIRDTKIADSLAITAKAVGKIKKKLESRGIIKGYSIDINFDKLGFNAFAIAFIEPVMENWHILRKKGILKYMMHPNIIKSYNLTSEKYAVFFIFKNLDELDRFFHEFQIKLSRYFNIRDIFVISSKGIIKNSSSELMVQMMDGNKNIKSKMELSMYLTLVKNMALKK